MNESHGQLVRIARVAGFWYLLLAISGILGFMVLHSQIYVPSDPERTLGNLVELESLSRTRLVLELLIVLSQALAAVWFYRLFKSIREWEALAVATWGMVNAVAILISALSMAVAIDLAHSSVATHADKIVLIDLLGRVIRHAWGVGGLFFGLWLIPMGHMVVTSNAMPAWLGRILVLGGVGYLLKTFLQYAGFQYALSDSLTLPATVGEFWMIGYLLIFGIRPWKEPSDATLHAADRITGANGP